MCDCGRKVTGSGASEQVPSAPKMIAKASCSRKSVTITHLSEDGDTVWIGYSGNETTPGSKGNVPIGYEDQAIFEGQGEIWAFAASGTVELSVIEETYLCGG